MLLDVAACQVVVEEVSEDFAKEDTANRCKIQKTNPFIREAISTSGLGLGEEYAGGDIDTDCPGKDEKTTLVLALEMH